MPEAKITLTTEGAQSMEDALKGLVEAAKAAGVALKESGDASNEASAHASAWGSTLSSVFGSFPAHVVEGRRRWQPSGVR